MDTGYQRDCNQTMDKTAANKVLPKAGQNGFDWTEVQGSTFILRLNLCANSPRLRQYPKRCTKTLSSCAGRPVSYQPQKALRNTEGLFKKGKTESS